MNKKYELTNSDKNGLYPKVLITSFKGKIIHLHYCLTL